VCSCAVVGSGSADGKVDMAQAVPEPWDVRINGRVLTRAAG
jgi:hypothetical protein